jgi:hypothetical protein
MEWTMRSVNDWIVKKEERIRGGRWPMSGVVGESGGLCFATSCIVRVPCSEALQYKVQAQAQVQVQVQVQVILVAINIIHLQYQSDRAAAAATATIR